jgi:hypothetical protein
MQFKNYFWPHCVAWGKGGVTTKSYAYFGVIHGWWRTWFLGGVCYEKLKSATIALIFPCHQHNAREMWAKYSLQPRPWITTDFDHRPGKLPELKSCKIVKLLSCKLAIMKPSLFVLVQELFTFIEIGSGHTVRLEKTFRPFHRIVKHCWVVLWNDCSTIKCD